MPGLTCQQCASLCNSAANGNASMQSTTTQKAENPSLFTRTRLLRADFCVGGPRPLFLAFNIDADTFVVEEGTTDEGMR